MAMAMPPARKIRLLTIPWHDAPRRDPTLRRRSGRAREPLPTTPRGSSAPSLRLPGRAPGRCAQIRRTASRRRMLRTATGFGVAYAVTALTTAPRYFAGPMAPVPGAPADTPAGEQRHDAVRAHAATHAVGVDDQSATACTNGTVQARCSRHRNQRRTRRTPQAKQPGSHHRTVDGTNPQSRTVTTVVVDEQRERYGKHGRRTATAEPGTTRACRAERPRSSSSRTIRADRRHRPGILIRPWCSPVTRRARCAVAR